MNTVDIEFWNNVREHYANKKKNLAKYYMDECVDAHFSEKSSRINKKLKIAMPDMKINAENVSKMDMTVLKNIICELKDCYMPHEKYAKALVLQNEPLLPPYTEEELTIAMKILNEEYENCEDSDDDDNVFSNDGERYALPEELFNYLTLVSRELYINKNLRGIFNLDNLLSCRQGYISTRSWHKKGCNCHLKNIETIPDECCLMTPEEKEEFRQDVEKYKKEKGASYRFRGFNVGSKDDDPGYKVIICDKNSPLFGKVFKQKDDSMYGDDDFIKYADSLSEILRVKMDREQRDIDDMSDIYTGDLYDFDNRKEYVPDPEEEERERAYDILYDNYLSELDRFYKGEIQEKPESPRYSDF